MPCLKLLGLKKLILADENIWFAWRLKDCLQLIAASQYLCYPFIYRSILACVFSGALPLRISCFQTSGRYTHVSCFLLYLILPSWSIVLHYYIYYTT